MTERGHTCPSSTCTPGNVLLGIVRPDGTVAGVHPPLPVDAEWAARASSGPRPPESRFRFAGPCVESRCGHWDGARCGVADQLVGDRTTGPGEDVAGAAPTLPPCPIRSTCRWWAQRGAAACAVCPTVVRIPSPERGGAAAR